MKKLTIKLTQKQIDLVRTAIFEYGQLCADESLIACTTKYDEFGPQLKTGNPKLSKRSRELAKINDSIYRQIVAIK